VLLELEAATMDANHTLGPEMRQSFSGQGRLQQRGNLEARPAGKH
jgi:hypothetical protein